jgi:hypothetical protein
MYKILFIVSYVLYNFVWAQRARLWMRIPKFYVDNRVNRFLNEHRLNNCYEFQETPNMLLLKCWQDNRLTNARIIIDEETKKQRYFDISVSI